jgi:hypothetical protein
MCIFYFLHEMTNFNPEISEGKRNSRIFILGIIIYCLIYILLVNVWELILVNINLYNNI